MDYPIDPMLLENPMHGIGITDIRFNERVIVRPFYIRQILEITRIREQVKIDDVEAGVAFYKSSNDVTSDEAGATGYKNIFHSTKITFRFVASSNSGSRMVNPRAGFPPLPSPKPAHSCRTAILMEADHPKIRVPNARHICCRWFPPAPFRRMYPYDDRSHCPARAE
jgi:hypothetical protein